MTKWFILKKVGRCFPFQQYNSILLTLFNKEIKHHVSRRKVLIRVPVEFVLLLNRFIKQKLLVSKAKIIQQQQVQEKEMERKRTLRYPKHLMKDLTKEENLSSPCRWSSKICLVSLQWQTVEYNEMLRYLRACWISKNVAFIMLLTLFSKGKNITGQTYNNSRRSLA